MTESLTERVRDALIEYVLAAADDELILGHRNSEWTGHAPILEEDIAFSNIAQDELGHAAIWYGILSDLSEADPDGLVFFRTAAAYRNVQMVELPKGDWAFSMMRQFLFDAFEIVRARRLVSSLYQPIAEAAAKILPEELYHHRHTGEWIRRLGMGTDESNRRTQNALDKLWPFAAQLFVPTPDADALVAARYLPSFSELNQEWEQLVIPFLADAGLSIPQGSSLEIIGREQHTPHLAELLEELQQVARLDAEAAW